MQVEKSYTVKGDFDQVVEVFSDLNYFASLHPLISTAKLIDDDHEAGSEYEISEKPFSWFPLHIKYTAYVKEWSNLIQYKLGGIPFTNGSLRYEFLRTNEMETQVKFRLKMSSNFLILKILPSKIVNAQDQIMKKLSSQLAG